MNEAYIYGLYDPRDGQLRYIGKTKRPKLRPYEHITSARRKPHTHIANWLRRLVSLGLRPLFRIIEETTEAQWEERERCWIKHFKLLGVSLTNSTPGGEGGPTMKGKTFSESHRKAISKGLKGHPVSEKVRTRAIIHGWKKGEPSHNRTEIDDNVLFELYVKQGKSSRQVANILGIKPGPVLRRLRELSWVRQNVEAIRIQKRELHKYRGGSKLTPDDIRNIRLLITEGVTLAEIAARYGLKTWYTVSKIKRGKTWKWVK